MRITTKAPIPNTAKKFSSLAAGRNKILWGYFGLCDEYPIILSMIRKHLLTYSPDVSVTIAAREEARKWTEDTISEQDFRNAGEDWIEKIEFKTSPAAPHIIEKYISMLPIRSHQPLVPKGGSLGLIITNNQATGRKLLADQIRQSEIFLSKYGLVPVQCANGPEAFSQVRAAGAVVGVEHPAIWAAVRDCKPVAVPDYSVGLNLLTKFGAIILK